MKFMWGIVCIGFLIWTLNVACATEILSTLVSFNGTNGANPGAALVQSTDGNFYGTTVAGGANGYGVIFRTSPWGLMTNLASFANTNGAAPRGAIATGLDGDFYGTAYNGGGQNFGAIFKLTSHQVFSQLYSFSFSKGGYPIAGLTPVRDGSFYGTTAIGGVNSGGTIFRFNTNGTITTLVSFGFGGTNGDSPYANLVQTTDGNLYGSTYQGGTNGNGTLFRLATNGTFTTVHLFTGTNGGANPYAGLIQGLDTSLYGTTFFGGAAGFGTVFKLTEIGRAHV